MTAFLSKTFTVAEGHSDVPNRERQQNWSNTFKNSCPICDRLCYAQAPMRNQKCAMAGCQVFICPEHKEEHLLKEHNFQKINP